MSDLVFDAHGNLYGTTHGGGDFGDGTVFELTPVANGFQSEWKETVIHSFHKDRNDGAQPSASIVFDEAGNLWGTTEQGGTDYMGTGAIAGGTVFELSPGPNGAWSETVYSFQHARIYSRLVFDKAGNIYGTTLGDSGDFTGGGTVFRLTRGPDGKYSPKTLYAFKETRAHTTSDAPYVDGRSPVAGVILDKEGNLYGTTSAGGAGTTSNGGTFFKLTRGSNDTWTETVLHNFDNNTGGPIAVDTDLIMDSHGNLYGTAYGGANGYGTVFELTPGPNGKWSEVILHNFNNGEGIAPHCRLAFDKAGNLYGTASAGGTFGRGTVFKLSPSPSGTWSMIVLHSLAQDGTEGSGPWAGLIFDAQGNLYGTAPRGGGDPGSPGHGVVFEILADSGSAAPSDAMPTSAPTPTTAPSIPASPTVSSSPASPGPSSPDAPQVKRLRTI
jgi:uncharacterized repeat protein (TIGR03803 family)